MRPTQGIVLLGCALVAACGSEPAVPATGEVQAPAKLTTGDVTVRATALPSMRLGDAMASRYGVARDPDTVLLVIGMRRGPQSAETSVAGRVGAEANNLLGNRQRIALREFRSDGFIDYVGTARVSMPDTLRFTIQVQPHGAPAATLRFHRDYFP